MRPSWRAREMRKLQNRLNHAGVGIVLDTSDDTIEELKREAAKLEERAEAAKHDIVRVKLLATRANILVSLQRMQVYAEAAKKKAGEETPAEELETEALAYLKSRGWTCTRG